MAKKKTIKDLSDRELGIALGESRCNYLGFTVVDNYLFTEKAIRVLR